MPDTALDRIHLITCVGVDTELDHLPHFIRHYRALGIPRHNIHVLLNATSGKSGNLSKAKAMLAGHDIDTSNVWIAPYTSEAMWAKRREIQVQNIPADHWVISADVDEFHEYPESLADFLAECEARGVNCVQGVFIDRLASDGHLGRVRSDEPIWKTFPIQADVQCTIGQTGEHHDWFGTVKVMALKGDLFPDRGGHHPVPGDRPIHYLFGRHLASFPAIGQARFRFFIPLRVHHFKWIASMPETLRQRLATPGVSVAGAEYGQKLIDYFEANNGVRLADVPQRRSSRYIRLSWRRRLACLKALDAAHWYMSKTGKLVDRVKKRLTP